MADPRVPPPYARAQRAQRRPPSLLIALSIAAGACGEPTAGGQTGDPGVVGDNEITPEPDYVSLEPGEFMGPPPPGPGPGECDSAAPTANGGEVARGLAPIDATRALFLDRSSARVVDLSNASELQRRARLDLGQVLSVHALGASRALLAVQRPPAGFALTVERAAELGDDRIMLIDFGDPDAPEVIAEQAITGDLVLATVLERAGATRVITVSDAIDEVCFAPTKRTTVHAFTLAGDALALESEVELGSDVSAVAQRGEDLLVLEGRRDRRTGESSPAQASFIALDAADGMLPRSTTVPAPGPLGLQPRLWVERQADVWTLAAPADDGATRVMRYDLSERATPRVVADCALSGTGALGGMWVLGERVLLASWPNQDGNTLIELAPDCTTSERPDQWFARVPESDAVIQLDFAGADTLEARLLTGDGAQPIATASVALVPEPDSFNRFSSAPWASSVLADAVRLPAAGGAVETHLLAVPLQRAAAKVDWPVLQLFSFSADSLTARAQLAPARSLASATSDSVVVMSPGERAQLTSFALDARATSAPLGTLEVNPDFVRGYALDDAHWLRLRRPFGVARDRADAEPALSEDELLHPDSGLLAMLEVIATGGDPELVPALAQVGINPYAQLVRAGDVFVSVANREQSSPGTTRLELFDFGDALAPRARGTLETDALWVQDNDSSLRGAAIECLDCDPPGGDGPVALTTARAVVLRGYRWIANEQEKHGGHSSFAFEIVDLSDPDRPRLGRTLTMPEADHAHGAFAVGDDLYYRYARPVAGDSTRVRHFVRRIGLADPAEPELPEPINVPGQLVAASSADTLYTVELTRNGEKLQATLHRLKVRDGVARIAKSHVLGERRASAVSLTGDRLLVDLGGRIDAKPPVVDGAASGLDAPLRLLVLDAQSLEVSSEGDVAYGAVRLGASAGMVGYAAWTGALFVDPAAPEDVARQRFVFGSGSPPHYGRLQVAADRVLFVDTEAGRLRELAIEPAAAAGTEPEDKGATSCEPPPAADLEPHSCRLGHQLIKCTNRGGGTAMCLDACPEEDGFTLDRCESQCRPDEYAAACGGVGPMAPSNAPPSPSCRAVFGPFPGGGGTQYCCRC